MKEKEHPSMKQEINGIKPTSIMMRNLLPSYCREGVKEFNITEVIYEQEIEEPSGQVTPTITPRESLSEKTKHGQITEPRSR